MSRPTPETDAFAASEFVDKIDELTQLYDLSEKLERERDEAREELDEEMKFHHRTHAELVQTQCKLLDMEMMRDHAKQLERERDEARKDAQKSKAYKKVLKETNARLRGTIVGWENKWRCAVDMAARAELERDEALKCAKEYYVEFIRNASSDNKVSKPNPLNPFYKY